MIIDNPQKRHIPALRRLWQQAFGDSDAFLDSFFKTGFSYDRCRCVFREGEPVAAHYLFDCRWQDKKLVYLYALAVEKSHRGQGLSRLLMQDTHAQLRVAGYDGVVLEPADEGLAGYYGRLGYRSFGCRQEVTVTAGEHPVICRKIGQLGYEQARNRLLPSNAVEQYGAQVRFLQTYADCYGGEGFAAAVAKDGSFVAEFLGDTDLLPGFLKAIGIDSAAVRLPGGDKKTAMYLSLTEDGELPAYFGLPLD